MGSLLNPLNRWRANDIERIMVFMALRILLQWCSNRFFAKNLKMNRGNTLLVHCNGGRHRSPAVTAAILVFFGQMTREKAIDQHRQILEQLHVECGGPAGRWPRGHQSQQLMMGAAWLRPIVAAVMVAAAYGGCGWWLWPIVANGRKSMCN